MGTHIGADNASSGDTGRVTVGTTAARITTSESVCTRGVEIKADSNNSGQIYVGYRSTVTADSADSTDGFQIAAGEKTFVMIDDLSKVYFIGSAAGQKFWWKKA